MLRDEITVPMTHRAALYENGVFKHVLEPGRHVFWKCPFSRIRRQFTLVDIRNRSLTIKGQQILTADKVAIQLSILVYFRVTDLPTALHSVESYESRIYEDIQLTVRRCLAVKTLDDILKDRNEVSDYVRQDVRETATAYGVEITRADIKDLVFPGNLREIMNRVLETERQSQAMLIEAQKRAEALMVQTRAELAAQQSRLEADSALSAQLAASPMLLRLKELETIRRIAEKPGHHFYIGLGDVIPPAPPDRSGGR